LSPCSSHFSVFLLLVIRLPPSLMTWRHVT
jgi:hypothetical protein